MIGAICGDVIGSVYEFNNIKTKEFEFFKSMHKGDCRYTDDSAMTIAIAKACIEYVKDRKESDENVSIEKFRDNCKNYMLEIGRKNPRSGFGGRFFLWLCSPDPKPYNSFGNGSAMRVSPCGWVANSLEEAEKLAEASADVTHNHPEGIKGAKSIAGAIWLLRNGKSKEEVLKYIEDNYYHIDFTLDEIRPTYKFYETCQGSVPQAIEAFMESTDFEDAIRNAISIGGDSDTIAAITGSLAEACYGIPKEIKEKAISYLEDDMKEVVKEFKEMIN